MKIKQVEELVGITRKNIRFYEEQGLLNVERAENGYREYHQEDVIRLQEIKLFRKMDISIEEMKALFEKKKSLQICLEQHLRELEHRKEDLSKMQGMCERLILEHRSLDSLNAEDCLEEIEEDGERRCEVYGCKQNRYPKEKKNRSNCRCCGNDTAYGIYHCTDLVGEYTGSDSIRTASAHNSDSGYHNHRNAHSTCRKNERDRRRRRG